MKCLFKVLGTIALLPILGMLLIPTLFISIVLMLSGCVDEENTPIAWLFDFGDAWRQL